MTSSRRPARPPEPRRRRQRGLATLILTLALVFGALLAALYVHRNVLTGQLALANQQRSIAAFEAAEAGLDWAMAQLNDPQRIDADCRPSMAPEAASFRTRQLSIDPATGSIAPAAAGAACVRGAQGWSCRCTPGAVTPPADDPTSSAPTPAFRLAFDADPRAGVVHVRSFGCTRPAGGCTSEAAGPHDARAHVEADFALLPALRNAPGEAATGGVAAGAFVDVFGLERAAWRAQPAATRIDCSRPCTAQVAETLAASTAPALLWVDGDLALDGPATLGSAQRPVALVVTGGVRLNGAVEVHGLIHAASLQLAGTPQTGTRLRGALLSESTLAVDGAAQLLHDPAVLATLQHAAGSFVRVPGSWRDDQPSDPPGDPAAAR